MNQRRVGGEVVDHEERSNEMALSISRSSTEAFVTGQAYNSDEELAELRETEHYLATLLEGATCQADQYEWSAELDLVRHTIADIEHCQRISR